MGDYSIEPAREETGNRELDAAEREARGRRIECLEAGADPEADVVYRELGQRVNELRKRFTR
jgi:hypothetical protein